MKIEPKELIAAHGKPQAPRLPKAIDSAVEPPITAVSAAISTKPPLNLISSLLSRPLAHTWNMARLEIRV
jgi:hypothetical protein